SLYFPVFLQIRNLPSSVSRSQAHTPPRSRGAFSAPGVCTFASLTPTRGVGGAPRNVRVPARHPWGVPSVRHKTRVNALMTRDARLSALHRGVSPLRSFPRKRGPRFRGDERKRLTPLPAPPSGSSPETPLNEQGCESVA